jgi:hypothetical protein
MATDQDITEMLVPFAEKDQFKAECAAQGLRAIWLADLKRWAVNTKTIPASLSRWAEKSGKPPRHFVIACDYSYYPFASKAGAKWDPEKKVAVFRGSELPLELTGFRPARFSFQERMERELNGEKPPVLEQGKPLTLHKHQTEAVDWITGAWERRSPGFLLADSTGLGKTLAAWKAILEINKLEKRQLKILVTGPLGAMEAWREAILWAGTGGWQGKGNDITLTNYDRLKHLFDSDKKKAKSLKGVARFGTADPFDIIVIDESHYLKNPASGRTKLARALEKSGKFCIWMSATAGQNPLEISYLSRLLAYTTGDKPTVIEKDFEVWCQQNGIGLRRGQFGKWLWDGNNADNEALSKILFGKEKVALRRRCEDIAGWPELQRIPRGTDLDEAAKRAYVTEWNEFVRAFEEDRLERLKGKKDTAKGIAQLGRLRQKASLLRVGQTCDLAEELLEEGRQTAISVEYLGTLDAIRENLEKRGYKCGEFSGRNTSEREKVRKSYQNGELDVIIFTTEVSISLHQENPSDKPRAQIVHDLRWSAIEQEQVDGRSHRNGTHAPVYWCFARDTIEERVGKILLAKLESMNALRGDECSFGHIYKELGKWATQS